MFVIFIGLFHVYRKASLLKQEEARSVEKFMS